MQFGCQILSKFYTIFLNFHLSMPEIKGIFEIPPKL